MAVVGGTDANDNLWEVWGKPRKASMALMRGRGGRDPSTPCGAGNGRTIELGWTGTDGAVVGRLNASMALIRG